MSRVELTRQLGELDIRRHLSVRQWTLVCDEPFSHLFKEWGIDPARVLPVAEFSTALLHRDLAEFAIVCTEASEGPIQHKLKERGVRSAGLYSQVIPRLAARLSPRVHGEASGKVVLEFAIMCLPRSGSTLLAHELKRVGVGEPVEHFRGFLRQLLERRAESKFDLIKWWALVRSGHTVRGVFGTKILYSFWRMAEEYMLKEEREHMLEFFRRSPIIYIERSNKIAQTISDLVARRTGVWHLWNDNLVAGYRTKLATLDDDLQDAVSVWERFVRSEHELKILLQECGGSVVKIEYDDLVAEPKKVIAEAARSLGMMIPEDYWSAPMALRPTMSQTHERLYERLQAELAL